MHIRWRGLELPSVVAVDAATLSPTYGKFIAEPFERGFGSTIGDLVKIFTSCRAHLAAALRMP